MYSVVGNLYKLSHRDGGFNPHAKAQEVFTDRSYLLSFVNKTNSNYRDNGLWIEIDWEKTRKHPKFDKEAVIEDIKRELRVLKRGLGISTRDSYIEYAEDEEIHDQNRNHYIISKENDLDYLMHMTEHSDPVVEEEKKEVIGIADARKLMKESGWSVNDICEVYEFKKPDVEFKLREEEQNA